MTNDMKNIFPEFKNDKIIEEIKRLAGENLDKVLIEKFTNDDIDIDNDGQLDLF